MPVDESPRSIVEALDAEAALMHGAVMETAQRDEVRQFRCAAIGPMVDVVAVDVSHVPASGEHTAPVARFERATQRGRDAARLAAHVERLPAFVFANLDDTCIAGEASRRLDGRRRSLIEFAPPGCALFQGVYRRRAARSVDDRRRSTPPRRARGSFLPVRRAHRHAGPTMSAARPSSSHRRFS